MKAKKYFRGQTLIEFALVLPIALLLILGFFDLGRAVFYYSSLTNAVREAARYAIVNASPTNQELQDKVLEFGFGLNEAYLEVDDPVYYPTDSAIKTNISITATYIFQPVTPMIASILGNPAGIELVAQSNMSRISGFVR
jgi:hypothetical protein